MLYFRQILEYPFGAFQFPKHVYNAVVFLVGFRIEFERNFEFVFVE